MSYVGRFAPSPTGALHLGSLVAAVGSYLDARHHGGRWLVRIDDLDTPRVVPGCAERMLRTLEAFGLHWDGEVAWQSRHGGHYAAAFERLGAAGLTFECSCSRRRLAASEESGYPGTCRAGPRQPGPTATRFRVDEQTVVSFEDLIQGTCTFPLGSLGDVVVRRRDGLWAYQLAVVVDDALQGVTHVIRGADLLSSTAWQIALQGALGLPSPRFGHLPLVVEPGGAKLAKSRRSVEADPRHAGTLLHAALRLLRQTPPAELAGAPPATLLDWAVRHWSRASLRGVREVPAPAVAAEFGS